MTYKNVMTAKNAQPGQQNIVWAAKYCSSFIFSSTLLQAGRFLLCGHMVCFDLT
jgi:hypothetical protein